MKYFLTLSFAAVITALTSCGKKDGPAVPPAPVDSLPAPVLITPFRLLDSTQMISDLQLLSSDAFTGRKPGTTGIALSHNLIAQRLRTAGTDSLTAGYAQNFTYAGTSYKNFVAVIPGTIFPNQYIVIGAHFDHLGITANGAVYHGADDNASGVAALLAIAKYFTAHPPTHSICIAAWDAEEVGLRGSDYFLNNLPAPILQNQIRFNLNMDMIARSDNNTIWACGLSRNPTYAYLVDSIKTKTKTLLRSGFDKPTDPQDWTFLSDQGSFARRSIPFLYLGVEDHADYHRTTDTYEKIDRDRYVENANIMLQMARMLDRKLQ